MTPEEYADEVPLMITTGGEYTYSICGCDDETKYICTIHKAIIEQIRHAVEEEREACALLAKQHGDLAAAIGHKEHMRMAASIEQSIRQRSKSEE